MTVTATLFPHITFLHKTIAISLLSFLF